MREKRAGAPSKGRMRNLNQYKGMTDEEFDQMYEDKYATPDMSEFDPTELERLIKVRIDQMSNDYDLSDMKANDLMQLRAFVQAVIQLEDLENFAYAHRQEITADNVFVLEKVNKIISDLRRDITKYSDDLQLTKRVRASSKDATVIARFDELKKAANKFYKQKMLYVFCVSCRTLGATVWLLDADDQLSHLEFKCKRCGNIVSQELSPLYKTENKNLDDVLIP